MARSNGTIKFNVQDLLRDMDARSAQAHETVCEKIDTGFEKISTRFAVHEQLDTDRFDRLEPAILTYKSMKWVIRAVIGATVVFVVDLLGHLIFGAHS